jgi:3',5'-cyclic AMP phosphodiesterase CpdA
MDRRTLFTLGHISDLHFSAGFDKQRDDHSYSIGRLRGMEKILKTKKLDRLIVSGDVSDGGDRESLMNARKWLTGKFMVGASDDSGLELPPEIIGIIPGNHDAYNRVSGYIASNTRSLAEKVEEYRQKTLDHFNEIFPECAKQEKGGIRYDYLETDDRGLFIVYLDTCYLGEPDAKGRTLNILEKAARGTVSREQSAQVHRWFIEGLKGRLEFPGAGRVIDKVKFCNSLKIIVAHHYLYEPKNHQFEELLQLVDRRAVFANLATADFDLYLCGHKHVSDFWVRSYRECFEDKRAVARHLFNLFRRVVDIHPLPAQLKNENGTPVGRSFTSLLWLGILRKLSLSQAPENSAKLDTEFVDSLADELINATDNPKEFKKDMENFLRKHRVDLTEVFEKDELMELQKLIYLKFTAEERRKVKGLARQIRKIARGLGARQFVQVMAGTAGKKITEEHESPSFNVYEISAHGGTVHLKFEKYLWDEAREEFLSEGHKFHEFPDHQKAMLEPEFDTLV